jgi:hypothetical protein
MSSSVVARPGHWVTHVFSFGQAATTQNHPHVFPLCLDSPAQSLAPAANIYLLNPYACSTPCMPNCGLLSGPQPCSPLGSIGGISPSTLCARDNLSRPPASFARVLPLLKITPLHLPLFPSVCPNHCSLEISASKRITTLPYLDWWRTSMAPLGVFLSTRAGPIASLQCCGAHTTELQATRPPVSSSVAASLLHRCTTLDSRRSDIIHPTKPQNDFPTFACSSMSPPPSSTNVAQ